VTRPIPFAAIDIVMHWEGFRGKAYLCPANVWTIGFGSTKGVKEGDTITRARAQVLLREDMQDAVNKLYGVVPADVIDDLTENQYAALLSFVFNLGANKSWTIWKVLRARDFDGVPAQMQRFVYAGGKKLQGLVNRRADEVALWHQDDPTVANAAVPSSTTRSTPTPPAPAPEKPLVQSKTVWAGAATAAAGAVEVAKEAQAVALPHAGQSGLVQGLASNIAVVIVLLGLAIVAIRWFDARSKKQ
jgi:lysozyme